MPAAPALVLVITGFAYALRDAGIAANRARLTTCLQALALLDVMDVDAVYWATRLTLCSEPDDLPQFDRQFDYWFRGHIPTPTTAAPNPKTVMVQPFRTSGPDSERDDPADGHSLATAASDAEVLGHRDIAALSQIERDEVNRMIALLAPRMGRRPTMRRDRGGRERIATARTVRAMLRDGGEPGRLAYDRCRHKPRRLVLLLDVSGSMAPYSDVLLRFAHAAVRVAPSSTEVFTVSTRLTRVTRQLRLRDADLPLRNAGAAVPDWSGGTRLGECIKAFLDLWGQRGTARRAVVVVASDGWERGDTGLLTEQMARLARLSHRIVWINPHRGKTGFAPLTAGMSAALPVIDELVAGHSFEALRAVAAVIARS